MQWLQKLRPGLPTHADDAVAEPVDLPRGLATLVCAFSCFGAAAMVIIVSLRIPAATWLVPVFIVAGMAFLCVQPNAQMTLRRIPRAALSPAAVPAAVVIVLVVLAFTVLGTASLWAAVGVGVVWGAAKGVLWVARARERHTAIE